MLNGLSLIPMASVFVVFSWRDYRKENDADILGVYRKRETAERALQAFVQEFATKYERTIEGEKDTFSVHDGNDYQIFELKEQVVIEE